MLSQFFEDENGAGKTALLKKLTGVSEGTIGLFTAGLLIGVYDFERAKFQMVEEPALHDRSYLTKLLGGIRNAELIALVIDLSRDPIEQVGGYFSRFLEDHVFFSNYCRPSIKVEKTESGRDSDFFPFE